MKRLILLAAVCLTLCLVVEANAGCGRARAVAGKAKAGVGKVVRFVGRILPRNR